MILIRVASAMPLGLFVVATTFQLTITSISLLIIWGSLKYHASRFGPIANAFTGDFQ